MDKNTLENILKECGVELYDTEVVQENGHKIYRVYIKSDDGITLDKCAQVSSLLSPIFDVEPPVEGKYFLEVSSPGVERKLKKPLHFQKSVGELVKVTHNEFGKMRGKIKSASEESFVLENDKEEKELKYSDISKAKTYYQW